MKTPIKALALAVLSCLPLSAFSATATTTMPVTATVLNVCTVAALPLAFGNYDPTSATATDGSSTISVLCTLSQAYTLRLSQGVTGTAVTARKLIRTSGTELLGYSLYRDSSRTLNWGVTDATDTVDATGTGLTQTHTVYGRIPAGAAVAAGAYTDTVTVTVNY